MPISQYVIINLLHELAICIVWDIYTPDIFPNQSIIVNLDIQAYLHHIQTYPAMWHI